MEPDRIVIGAFDAADARAVADLYVNVRAPVIRTDVASAEMIKYASNAFLATKISFINEIANVCEEVGADVGVVAQGMGLDARIGTHFLRPGIGYGGSCFPKDVKALKQLAGNSGYHFQLLMSVIEVNDLQKRRVVGKLERHLGSLRGTRIALLGLAFKADTDDMREASSLVLAARLRAEGATVVGYDPVAMTNAAALLGADVELAGSMLEAVTGADAAVIVTEWGEFRQVCSAAVRERDADAAARRRPQPARPRAGAGGRVRVRVGGTAVGSRRRRPPRTPTSPLGDRGRPRRRGGHAPAPAHPDDAEADAARGQPAVPGAPDRAPARARDRPHPAGLRIPPRRDPGPLRRPPGVHRRARAARDGRVRSPTPPAASTRRSSSQTATCSPTST